MWQGSAWYVCVNVQQCVICQCVRAIGCVRVCVFTVRVCVCKRLCVHDCVRVRAGNVARQRRQSRQEEKCRNEDACDSK
jgi:hypothetical protein